MRFQRIIEQVYFRPWAITPSGWEAVHRIVQARVLGTEASILDDMLPDEDELPEMDFQDGIATIPVIGTIIPKASLLERQCGAVGVADISADLETAVESPDVRAILLNVDSPGGVVTGVPELAQMIADANKKKPVYAFTDGMMCSAAYWISSGAGAVYATPSAEVGSIGVYIPWIDQTEAFKAEGLRVELIKAGKYKGMGYPGTALSDDQRQYLQDGVLETHAEFKSAVKLGRKYAAEDAMEGQTFTGKQAQKQGLVSVVVNSMRDVRAEILTKINR